MITLPSTMEPARSVLEEMLFQYPPPKSGSHFGWYPLQIGLHIPTCCPQLETWQVFCVIESLLRPFGSQERFSMKRSFWSDLEAQEMWMEILLGWVNPYADKPPTGAKECWHISINPNLLIGARPLQKGEISKPRDTPSINNPG